MEPSRLETLKGVKYVSGKSLILSSCHRKVWSLHFGIELKEQHSPLPDQAHVDSTEGPSPLPDQTYANSMVGDSQLLCPHVALKSFGLLHDHLALPLTNIHSTAQYNRRFQQYARLLGDLCRHVADMTNS